jgi:hypothetical protein
MVSHFASHLQQPAAQVQEIEALVSDLYGNYVVDLVVVVGFVRLLLLMRCEICVGWLVVVVVVVLLLLFLPVPQDALVANGELLVAYLLLVVAEHGEDSAVQRYVHCHL